MCMYTYMCVHVDGYAYAYLCVCVCVFKHVHILSVKREGLRERERETHTHTQSCYELIRLIIKDNLLICIHVHIDTRGDCQIDREVININYKIYL